MDVKIRGANKRRLLSKHNFHELRKKQERLLPDKNDFIGKVTCSIIVLVNICYSNKMLAIPNWYELLKALDYFERENENIRSVYKSRIGRIFSYEDPFSNKSAYWEKRIEEVRTEETKEECKKLFRRFERSNKKLNEKLRVSIGQILKSFIDEMEEKLKMPAVDLQFLERWKRFYDQQEYVELNFEESDMASAAPKKGKLLEFFQYFEKNSEGGPRLLLTKIAARDKDGVLRSIIDAQSFESIEYWKETLEDIPVIILLGEMKWSTAKKSLIPLRWMPSLWRPIVYLDEESPFEDHPQHVPLKLTDARLSKAILQQNQNALGVPNEQTQPTHDPRGELNMFG